MRPRAGLSSCRGSKRGDRFDGVAAIEVVRFSRRDRGCHDQTADAQRGTPCDFGGYAVVRRDRTGRRLASGANAETGVANLRHVGASNPAPETDFFLISIALGDPAIAALEFGYQYYFLTLTVGMVVANGSISVVSRYVGSGNQPDADFTVEQVL